ncbi:uncharacterized protein LOC108670756 isoform X2 [Hyalella azteca]|uniref:Uncharacterized protein LOC108670756 isoform X2 n=1 Tax=Hyalella azteca TaxID=294128 RepID=A0A8B7NJB6_HYAAZ|nr:uncharacterized protein LOC108670756 isoform X2 [Hyalella azteca]
MKFVNIENLTEIFAKCHQFFRKNPVMPPKKRKSITTRLGTGATWAVLNQYDQPTESDLVQDVPLIGHAIRFCLEHNKSYTATCAWIDKVFGVIVSMNYIKSLMKKYIKFSKNTNENLKEDTLAKLRVFCEEPLGSSHPEMEISTVQLEPSTSSHASLPPTSDASAQPFVFTPTEPTSEEIAAQIATKPSAFVQLLMPTSGSNIQLSTISPRPAPGTYSIGRRLCKCEDTTRKRLLRNHCQDLSLKIAKLKSIYHERMKMIRSTQHRMPIMVKNPEKRVKRQNEANIRVKKQVKLLQEANIRMDKTVKFQQKVINTEKIKRQQFQLEVLSLKSKIQEQKDEIKFLKNQNELIVEEKEESWRQDSRHSRLECLLVK